MNTVRARRDEREDKARIAILILICILLYLLIRAIGYIEHNDTVIPNTGVADIFEITCDCCKSDEEGEGNKHDSNNGEQGGDYDEDGSGGIIVYDDYKIWGNKELRIFANPMYGDRHLIAPGSYNSYAFIIKNNNNFDIVVDIIFDETNDELINMQYKLKHQGEYLLGGENVYEKIVGLKIENIILPAKSQKEYVLDWRWVDDDYNDTIIGFDATAIYKLKITVASK